MPQYEILHAEEPVKLENPPRNDVKMMLICKTIGTNYPKTLAFVVWNKTIEVCQDLPPGTIVDIEFEASSKEHNGRWRSELKLYKINRVI